MEVTVKWTDLLVDLKFLRRKWLTIERSDNIETFHPKLIGFEHFLKSYRSRSIDSVESIATIHLPVQVQTHISEKYNSGWSNSTARIVYIELSCHEGHYGTVHDNSLFEIC